MTTYGQKLDEIRKRSKSTQELGHGFEQLFMHMVKTEAVFGIKDIWPWRLWPDREKKLGLSGADVGVDLVAESVIGEVVAIQCKCYTSEQRVGKADIDSFLSFSNTHDISTDQLQNVFSSQWVVSTSEWTRNADEFVKAQGKRLKRIDFDSYAALSYQEAFTGRQVRRPFPFQQQAIDNCLTALYHNGHTRGRLIMACGTGKTFVSLRVAEELVARTKNNLVLFLAPSIALVSQARREWLTYSRGMLPLVVCSDRTAGGKDEDISLAEMPAAVTTDPAEIAQFAEIEQKGMKVVFCTYQSLRRVVEAQTTKYGLPEFTLTIADEAHRTTGVINTKTDTEKADFQLVHDADALRSERRLYMTATPRVYDSRSSKKAEEKGYEVVDMGAENSHYYGPEIHRVSFGDGVKENILSEYRVIVLGLSIADVTPGLRRGIDGITWEGSKRSVRPMIPELVRVLGTSLAVNGIYRLENDNPEPLQKVLAYANTIARSKWFRDALELPEIKNLTTRRMEKGRAYKLRASHIDGSASAGERGRTLRDLDQADLAKETRVVTNAKLFTEGVDVPSLDAVVFLDPRDSQVDVVQAVGRVMRKAKGKRYGYIVVPVILNEDKDWLAALEQGSDGYQTIGKVLRALQSHDVRLAEEPEKLVHVATVEPNPHKPPKEGDGPARVPPLIDAVQESLFSSLRQVDQQIFAKVVATSRLGRPGQLVADQIDSAVKYAADVFKRSGAVSVLAEQLDLTIEPSNAQADSTAAATIAALVLCNACLLHKRLKESVDNMRMLTSLNKLNFSSEPIGELVNQWTNILEIDYKPVFAPAISILDGLRRHHLTNESTYAAIRPLIECANQVADSLSELGYDHAGPLYHQILPSAQSDGAYYTNNVSALMLARLALNEEFIDWSDEGSVKELRIMDPACGTGTLLMATCKIIKDRVMAANPTANPIGLHKTIVEKMLCGLDINHHAVQLAGCNLTLGAPTVDYERINVARMRHGTRNEVTGDVHLGSLDLLDPGQDLNGLTGVVHEFETLEELGAESTGGGQMVFPHKDLTMVIMNPPFTENEKRGSKFSDEVQVLMRERERGIRDLLIKADELSGNSIDQNSFSTFFTPLAEKLVDQTDGTIALVLPTTALTATSGANQRKLLVERFDIEYVCTSHDPKRPNFSENTSISESLLVGRRKAKKSKQAKFINLKRMPGTQQEGIKCVDSIVRGDDTEFGEIIEWDQRRFKRDDWRGCLFVHRELAEIASELARFEPNGRSVREVFKVASELARFEPDGRSVRGVFKVASGLARLEPVGRRTSNALRSETNKGLRIALWNHKSDLRRTLAAKPDSIVQPKKGKKSNSEKLWTKASPLLIANRIRTTNVRTCAVLANEPLIGSAWVPVSPEDSTKTTLAAWAVWLNSSWTAVQFLGMRSKDLTYPKFGLEQIRSLAFPDPKLLDLSGLAAEYKKIKNRELLPWHSMNDCPIRRRIDHVCAEVLSLEQAEGDLIRELVSKEPTVNPNAASD